MAEERLATLFQRYGLELRRFLLRRLGNADSALDLTQETFARAARSGAVVQMEDPRAYLYKIANNLLIDQQRSDRRHAAFLVEAPRLDQIADTQPSPERQALSREELAVLRQAILDLPPRGREVFLLHKFDGVSYDDIARRLGISPNTVIVHMVRSLAFCRNRLAAYRQEQPENGPAGDE